MKHSQITQAYYAQWLGVDASQLNHNGILWVYNVDRNKVSKGYSHPFDIYAYVTDTTIIVSYGDKCLAALPVLKERFKPHMTPEEISGVLSDVFDQAPTHAIKYQFTDKAIETLNQDVKKLGLNDYPAYHAFFKKAYPNCADISWIKEYFDEIALKGYCHGIMRNDHLVSMTDAPDMPFMADRVQEIGINTLPEYRGRGYAKSACLSCINEMIGQNICPQWSTSVDNRASQRLARAIGFDELFHNIILPIK